jgi:hypothetical protein
MLHTFCSKGSESQRGLWPPNFPGIRPHVYFRLTTFGRTSLDKILLVAESSTWQHITQTTEKIPCTGGIRTHDLSRRAASDLRLRSRGQWDQQCYTPKTQKLKQNTFKDIYARINQIILKQEKNMDFNHNYHLRFYSNDPFVKCLLAVN